MIMDVPKRPDRCPEDDSCYRYSACFRVRTSNQRTEDFPDCYLPNLIKGRPFKIGVYRA